MIRFEGVHKWFGTLHVLNDINLHVKPGEVVVVCGPSGSGKSTLIRTINKLEPINEGKLIVDGMDLLDKKTDINKLRAEIGFVFQQFNLYPHLTVLKNITLAPIKIRNMPAERGRGAGDGAPRARRAAGEAGRLPGAALRRAAAAGGHRAGAGHEAEDHALRRAHLGPRPRDDRRGAPGHEGPGRTPA